MNINRVSRELRDNLEPSYVYKGLYRHPELRNLFVSPEGVCVVKSNCIPIPVGIAQSGYYIVRQIPNRTHLHRVVAEVFLKQPRGMDLINHRDGVKTNPCVINLEWCTHSHNADHAFNTGLRDENIHLDVKNLETGEVKTCRSIQHAAKVIGCSGSVISSYLKRGLHRQYTLRDVFEIKLPTERWILTKNSIGKNSEPGNKGVVIRKIGTDKYFLFSSVPEAANYVAIKPHMFYSYLNKGTVDMKRLGYDVWYMADCDVAITDMIDLRKPRPKRLVPKRVAPMVKVFDAKTGKTIIHSSLQEFVNLHGFTKTAVAKSVHLTGKYKQYTIQYL